MNVEERKDFNIFIGEMEEQLKENAAKGGWKQEKTLYFLLRITDHMKTLVDIETNLSPLNQTPELIKLRMRESAHIANYAMMMHSNERRKLDKT